MQLFHNTSAMEDSTIVDITWKIVNAHQVPQLNIILPIDRTNVAYSKVKIYNPDFCLKIETLYPLIAMEMEYQFSNKKSALQISTFELATTCMVLWIGNVTCYRVQPQHLVGIHYFSSYGNTWTLADEFIINRREWHFKSLVHVQCHRSRE